MPGQSWYTVTVYHDFLVAMCNWPTVGEQLIRPDAEIENDDITTPYNEVETDHDGTSTTWDLVLMYILFQRFVQE